MGDDGVDVVGAFGQPRLDGEAAVLATPDEERHPEARRMRCDSRDERRVDDRQHGVGVLEEVPEVLGAHEEVHGYRHRAGAQAPQERRVEARRVVQHQQHALLAPHPVVAQPGGETTREAVHLGERHRRAVVGDDRDLVATPGLEVAVGQQADLPCHVHGAAPFRVGVRFAGGVDGALLAAVPVHVSPLAGPSDRGEEFGSARRDALARSLESSRWFRQYPTCGSRPAQGAPAPRPPSRWSCPPPPRADRAQPPLPCGDGTGRGAVPRSRTAVVGLGRLRADGTRAAAEPHRRWDPRAGERNGPAGRVRARWLDGSAQLGSAGRAAAGSAMRRARPSGLRPEPAPRDGLLRRGTPRDVR